MFLSLFSATSAVTSIFGGFTLPLIDNLNYKDQLASTFTNCYIGGAFRTAMIRTQIGSTVLALLRGDITQQDTDAIVNAANSSLLGGGGVDGAIHRAGGSQILEECRAIRTRQGECPTGEAVITSGGRLKARHVIHAVGPVWRGGGHDEDRLLCNAYRNSLRLAMENNIRTISFPSISAGMYGFPIERTSRVAFTTVEEFVRGHSEIREIRFVTFSQHDYDIYAPLFTATQ